MSCKHKYDNQWGNPCIECKVEKLEERLISTEKDMNHVPSFDCIKELQEKIQELERGLNMVRALGARPFGAKNPHKCPVCEGTGSLEIKAEKPIEFKNYEFYRKFASCRTCDGKGIVWG